jgi:hypothetical protein
MSGMELSFVDDRPAELLNATLDGLVLEYHAGTGSGSVGAPYSQLALRLRNLQVGKCAINEL